jgi:hypothetical protein
MNVRQTTPQEEGTDTMISSASVRPHQFASGDVQRKLLVLAAWFFLAVWLGVTGKLVTSGGLPIGIGAAIVLPLVVFALDGRLDHPLFGGLMRLDLAALIGAQTFRVIHVRTFVTLGALRSSLRRQPAVRDAVE